LAEIWHSLSIKERKKKMITGYAEHTRRAAYGSHRVLGVARLFRVLSSDTCVSVLSLLSGGEMTANDLLAKINTASIVLLQHLKALVNAGLVTVRGQGKQRYYAIDKEGYEIAMSQLQQLNTVEAG